MNFKVNLFFHLYETPLTPFGFPTLIVLRLSGWLRTHPGSLMENSINCYIFWNHPLLWINGLLLSSTGYQVEDSQLVWVMDSPFQLLLQLKCDLHEYIVRWGNKGDQNSFSRKELLNDLSAAHIWWWILNL